MTEFILGLIAGYFLHKHQALVVAKVKDFFKE